MIGRHLSLARFSPTTRDAHASELWHISRGQSNSVWVLTGMKEPSSWHTRPFPNLAVARAHTFGLELTRDNSCILRATQTRD